MPVRTVCSAVMAADDLIRGCAPAPRAPSAWTCARASKGRSSRVRPYMRSHGGGVELLDVVGDTVRIRLQGHCQGCPSSMVTLKLAVEKAIYEAAPDVGGIEVAEPVDPTPDRPPVHPGTGCLAGHRISPSPSVTPPRRSPRRVNGSPWPHARPTSATARPADQVADGGMRSLSPAPAMCSTPTPRRARPAPRSWRGDAGRRRARVRSVLRSVRHPPGGCGHRLRPAHRTAAVARGFRCPSGRNADPVP